MFLAAMRLGYSRRDIATLPYGELIYELAAMNEGDAHDEPKQDVAMATQEDIRSMLG